MDKLLKYNHPAVPFNGIIIGKAYTLEELQNKFTIEEIKCFFTPDNFSFDELTDETIKKK
jgi:hypothetical protein